MGDRPQLLDLFCGEGGAGHGYALAGWDVTGVDLVDRSSRYPHRFVRADALEYLAEHTPATDVRRELMGMPWATQEGVNLAIPPAYTEWIGAQLLALVGTP